MQQSVKFTYVWLIMWFFAGTLIWYHIRTHTHTQRHMAHWGASRLTHPYKYIFTPAVMCSQQLSLLHWMDNSLISKSYFPQFIFFSTIIHLQRSYICWVDAIRLGSSNNTDVKVNKTQTHTHMYPHTHTHTHTQTHQTFRER